MEKSWHESTSGNISLISALTARFEGPFVQLACPKPLPIHFSALRKGLIALTQPIRSTNYFSTFYLTSIFVLLFRVTWTSHQQDTTMAFLHWADYIIFIVFILVSLGIGVFHSVSGGRQKSPQEFINASRHLEVLPTVLSLVASFQSAIIILGSTAEMYNWGYAAWPLNLSVIILSLIITERIIVPWLYPLKITSVYEVRTFKYTFCWEFNLLFATTTCNAYFLQYLPFF